MTDSGGKAAENRPDLPQSAAPQEGVLSREQLRFTSIARMFVELAKAESDRGLSRLIAHNDLCGHSTSKESRALNDRRDG